MVNLLAAAYTPLLHGLMKMAGVVPNTVEIEPGTVMNIWVPSETLKKNKNMKKKKKTSSNNININIDVETDDTSTKTTPYNKPTRPVVVLVHGFAADGIITWQFQVGSLMKKYSVYVPDLLFFGGSFTDNPDRSPTFQAECLVKGLRKLGIERCLVVGFSYGGIVGFKMAELYPDLVESLVISGSVVAMTDSISTAMLQDLGVSSFSQFLLPTSVEGCKALLKSGAHMKLWFPDCLHNDFLEVMFNNSKERAELLDAFVLSAKHTSIPKFSQRIHLLWGEQDKIFKLERAQNMKEQLGDKTTIQGIKKAGHLVHLERPCVYNRCLKQFLSSLQADEPRK